MLTGWERPSHWLVLAVVVVVLFGYKKLPEMSRSVGRSLRIFKTEMKGMSDDDSTRNAADAPPAPPAPAAPAVDVAPPVPPAVPPSMVKATPVNPPAPPYNGAEAVPPQQQTQI